MYFSWLDYEVAKIYRKECIEQAQKIRLIRSSQLGKKGNLNFMQRNLQRLGTWLETLGHHLQGVPFKNGNDLPSLRSREASYE